MNLHTAAAWFRIVVASLAAVNAGVTARFARAWWTSSSSRRFRIAMTWSVTNLGLFLAMNSFGRLQAIVRGDAFTWQDLVWASANVSVAAASAYIGRARPWSKEA